MLLQGTRVSRAELDAETSSPAPSLPPEDAEELRARLNDVFGNVDEPKPLSSHTQEETVGEASADEELEFQLFSFGGPSKIKVRSPIPEEEGDGFVISQRPRSYYFVGDLGPEILEQYRISAISGGAVVELSKRPCPGLARPWKVITTGWTHASKAGSLQAQSISDVARKKCRKSKKHRIALRKKAAAENERLEAAKKAAAEKEAYLREKKSRENRKKQIKKRAKEKAKKEALVGPGENTNLG